jgi:hypothetical protein
MTFGLVCPSTGGAERSVTVAIVVPRNWRLSNVIRVSSPCCELVDRGRAGRTFW